MDDFFLQLTIRLHYFTDPVDVLLNSSNICIRALTVPGPYFSGLDTRN